MTAPSLLPPDAPIRRGLSAPTWKAIAALIIVIAAAIAAHVHVSGQLHNGQAALNAAQARQQQLQLETDTVKSQLGDLVASGGRERLEQATALIQARPDWKRLLLAITAATEPGITIDSINLTAPAAGAPVTVPLTGTTQNRDLLKKLLRNFRANKETFSGVRLRRASRTPGTGTTTWGMDVTISAPEGTPVSPAGSPAAPADPAAAPAPTATPAP